MNATQPNTASLTGSNEAKSSHTQGPWEYYHEVLDNGDKLKMHFETVRGADGKNIVRLHKKEDAKLIAAAPDLLSALEEIARMCEPSTLTPAQLIGKFAKIAKEAIAKAKTI